MMSNAQNRVNPDYNSVVMLFLAKSLYLQPQCHRYWPEDGQPIITYRIYEVGVYSVKYKEPSITELK